MESKVLVAVRIRPKLEGYNALRTQEERYALECCTRVDDVTCGLSEQRGKETKSYVFCFDAVFDKDSTQEDIYDGTAQELVDAAISGNFATILAYGQTGSGKTYTVLGAVRANPLGDDFLIPDTGLLLRVFKDLLAYRDKRSDHLHVTLALSVIEIYCDDTRDLLSSESDTRLKVVTNDTNVFIQGLRVERIECLGDVMKFYKTAMGRRVSRATQCNDESSRSHALFTIDMFQQEKTSANPQPIPIADMIAVKDASNPNNSGSYIGMCTLTFPTPKPGPPVIYSKIVLADLAGSEKVKKADVKGQAFEEMVKINASLTSLGNVVHALYAQAKHIPYRDSKLTILLRNTFASQNARVCLIANVAPSSVNFDETLSTLYFANKVKQMKVAGGGTLDFRLENEYLSVLKFSEQITSDIRILEQVHDYVLQLRENPENSPLVAAPYYISRYTNTNSKAKRDAEVHRYLQYLSTPSAVEERRRKKESELNAVYTEHKSAELEAFHRQVRERQEKIQLEEADIEESRRGLDEDDRANQKQIHSIESEIYGPEYMKQKEEHKKLSDALERVKNTQSILEKDIGIKTAEFRRLNQDIEEEWDAFKLRMNSQDNKFEKNKQFFNACMSQRKVQLDYYSLKLANAQMYDATLALKRSSERTAYYSWIRAIVLDVVQTVLGPSEFESPDSPKYFGSAVDLPTSSNVPRRGTSVYDSPSILSDIIAYLQAGCTVFKFGKNGLRPRHMFIMPRAGTAGKPATYTLHWETGRGDSSSNSGMEVSAIREIVLGQCARTFKNIKSSLGTDLQQNNNYYLSFSIIHNKKSQRTLSVIVEAVPEFEAWVIGLSHLTQRAPAWGEPLIVTGNMDISALDNEERELCLKSHIHPLLYLQTKEQLLIQPQELTRGELRGLLPLDYFRASALWSLFVKRGLIIDPNDHANSPTC